VTNLIIKTDKDWVIQILVNLVSNSLKFINQGFIHLKVTRINTNIVFEVEDTGPGISEKD